MVPGVVLEDPQEPNEMPEPNPKDEPVAVLEDDTKSQGSGSGGD